MGIQQTKRQKSDIIRDLPDTALVLDVGGGAYPCARADYIIDIQPYIGGGGSRHLEGNLPKTWGDGKARFTQDTWIVKDICERSPWPFRDKFFDFSICSHTLEDIRDPIWVCSELIRVSRRGLIETPSRLYETSFGIESDYFAGAGHHRWIVELIQVCLTFSFKMDYVHLPMVARLNPPVGEDRFLRVIWENSFEYRENLYEMSTAGIFSYFLGKQISQSDLEECIYPSFRRSSWKNGLSEGLRKNIRKVGPLYSLLRPIYRSIRYVTGDKPKSS